MAASQVTVRRVQADDGADLVTANLGSIGLHEPWVSPCRDQGAFLAYLKSCDGERKIGFIVRERAGRRVAGVINVSEIVRGFFQSACLGYYGMAGFSGRGLMSQALAQVVSHSFTDLALHRLEANIQPDNAPSLALVRRLGFRKEGYSPRFLRIGGEWRDHERWALLSDEWPASTSDGR
jgi:ribosomal-protein-alanine N-acetyltransferase